MTREEVHNKLNNVFRDVFDDETIVLNDSMTSNDIEGWDSLMQITLVSSIEGEFDICFNLKDIQNVTNVGEMVDLIEGMVR